MACCKSCEGVNIQVSGRAAYDEACCLLSAQLPRRLLLARCPAKARPLVRKPLSLPGRTEGLLPVSHFISNDAATTDAAVSAVSILYGHSGVCEGERARKPSPASLPPRTGLTDKVKF